MAIKTRVKYVSKGQRPNVSTKNKARCSPIQTVLRKLNSYLEGKTSYLTVPNPNPKETNKRMIRLPYNQTSDLLSDYRKASRMPVLK